MKLTIGEFVGFVCFLAVVIAVTFNSIFMLVSPSAWFRLPPWIRLTGSLTERRYGHGRGTVEVRLTGAVFLAVIAGIFVHFFGHPQR